MVTSVYREDGHDEEDGSMDRWVWDYGGMDWTG